MVETNKICQWCFKPIAKNKKNVANRIFCSRNCREKKEKIYQKIKRYYEFDPALCSAEIQKLAQQGKNYKNNELEKTEFATCLWCKAKIKLVSIRSQKYCDCICREHFYKAQKRVYQTFPFEGSNVELAELERLGKYYKFPEQTEVS